MFQKNSSLDLLTTVQENCKDFDKEGCFKLEEFMPEKIKATIQRSKWGLNKECYVRVGFEILSVVSRAME